MVDKNELKQALKELIEEGELGLIVENVYGEGAYCPERNMLSLYVQVDDKKHKPDHWSGGGLFKGDLDSVDKNNW